MLWVAKNIPGLSKSHREAVLARFGISAAELDSAGVSAAERYNRLDAARLEKLALCQLARLAAAAADRLSGLRDLAAVS